MQGLGFALAQVELLVQHRGGCKHNQMGTCLPQCAVCPPDRMHTHRLSHYSLIFELKDGFSWWFLLGETLLLMPHESLLPKKPTTQSSHTQVMG